MKTMALMLAAAALPIGAPALAQTMTLAPALQGTRLDVVATGTTSRTPDVATVRAGVVTQGTTAAQAMQANAAQMSRVLAALKRAGVADRDVATATLSLAPQYRYGENVPPVITGYQASNAVSVRFRDVARSGGVLDALVSAGANQIEGPNLAIDKPEAALDEARTQAVAKARARADLYAKAAGMTVRRIVSIAEAGDSAPGPQPMYRLRAQAVSADATQIAPGETDVTATVNVTFELQ